MHYFKSLIHEWFVLFNQSILTASLVVMKFLKGCWAAASLDLCSALGNFPAAGVSELCGPHQRDSSLSDLQTGVGGSTQNERDMCPAGPSPTSEVPALPTYLRTSTLSVSSSNNEHPCPLCLQNKGHDEPFSSQIPHRDTGPGVSSSQLTKAHIILFSNFLHLNVPSVSCLRPTDSKGMIFPIRIYFVVVNKIQGSHNVLVFVLSVVILSVLVCGM